MPSYCKKLFGGIVQGLGLQGLDAVILILSGFMGFSVWIVRKPFLSVPKGAPLEMISCRAGCPEVQERIELMVLSLNGLPQVVIICGLFLWAFVLSPV